MRLLIAIDEDKGENSKLSEHFGHCPYFAIYETNTKEIKIIKNKLEHSNPNISPVDQIMKINPKIVFSKGMGGRAIRLFEEKGVKIMTGKFNFVKEVIDNLNSLDKLKLGCDH
ncbi:MAG: NifB/NifX family molybdenum-iron cluster-binding protein [Nanoarchaeota archaeon]|nr:NifB/NifX family molybdenum-iron cluster-binding protein [Nanoarchaeota archaeon]MBU1028416.1 NifB/NifX family molybdenum-iron cluster-binding protein [Nanoarchaeota archaeon]